MKKIIAVLLVISFVLAAVSACSSDNSKETDQGQTDIYKYLGDYDYDSSLLAFVYEPVDGEDESGIQYRRVTDIEGLLKSGKTVLLYFYNSMSSDVSGVTAGMEDIAQCTWGDMLVVTSDVLTDTDLATRYQIEKVPEFVMIRSSEEISRFEGYNYDVWSMSDVAAWVSSNGIKVDYSKLN